MKRSGGGHILEIGSRSGHRPALRIPRDKAGQGWRLWEILPALDRIDVRQQLRVGERDIRVAEPFIVKRLCLVPLARVDPVGWTDAEGLARKAIDHRVDGHGLVGLNLEFELHGRRRPFLHS
nr:hypothetical protein [Novosphingobium sp. NDB2Meth1]